MAGAWPREVPEVEVLENRTHGLFYMLECLIDRPKRSPTMASNFIVRVGHWQPVAKALESWKDALGSQELSALRFPDGYGRTSTLSDVLEKVSLQSDSPQDFAERVSPWLGPETTRRFTTVLEILGPLYDRYWWTGPDLGGRKAELVADLERGRFRDNFVKAMDFYQGDLRSSKARVALVPYHRGVGESQVLTRGHNAGDLQVFEVVTDRPDPSLAGVCFHEFAHGLWKGQTPEEARRWKERFAAHGLWGRLAYAQLNEGLATALGNGWFHQKVTGESNDKAWYNDRVIESYARALFPLVGPIVEQSRRPSDIELDAMVEAFRSALPEADSTFDVVAADLLTITDRPEAHSGSYQDDLMRLGPVRSSRVAASLDGVPSATFVIFWRASATKPYLLRRTESGWELEFSGKQGELLKLLRELQATGLREP